MHISIQLSSSLDNHLVILTGNNKKVDRQLFNLSAKEVKYIEKKLDESEEIITINQYDRYLFVINIQPGKAPYQDIEKCRKLAHTLTKLINKYKISEIVIADHSNIDKGALYFAEGMALSNYQFLKYKKDADKQKNSLTKIFIKEDAVTGDDIDSLAHLTEGVYIARDLVNEHPYYLTAVQLSEEIKHLGNEAGFQVEVFNEAKIEALKMGGLMAVNRGSATPPTFNILEWKPGNFKNTQPFILVGKGVVYDTGGLSLKPTPNSMDFMKADMAGAAAVIGAIYAIAKSKLPIHVVGLIAATDNRLGENSYAPGDVIKMHNGLTVEVKNTDAEGRLTLADVLSYAKNYDPGLVIDIATLTGAAARAIGKEGAVFMGTAGDPIKQELIKSGNDVYERLVEFPLWDEYFEHIKSDIADLSNLGQAEAGAISAGKFLEQFTDYPWLHLDIAGGAFLHSEDNYRGKNGTGTGVRLFYNFLKKQIADE